MNIIVINMLVHIGTTLYFYQKKKHFDIHILYWIFLTVLSIFGYIGLETESYYDGISLKDANSFSVTPYILLYISNLIISWPLYSIKVENIDTDTIINSPKVDMIMKATVIFLIAYSILRVSEAMFVATIGFDVMYDIRHYGGEGLFHYDNIFLKILNAGGYKYYSIVEPFVVIYYFQRLVTGKGKVMTNVFCLVLAFIPEIATGLTKGSKGTLFFTAATICFYYALFNKMLSSKVKKYATICAVTGGLFFLSYATAIQYSRVGGDSYRTEETTIRYLAEPMLNIGYYYWDQSSYHPWGARIFPEFFNTPTFESISDRFDYWTPKTGVPEAKFTTTFGDFYIEFGAFFGIVFLFLFIALWKYVILKHYEYFHMIPILKFYFHVICMMGMFDFCFYDAATHISFVIQLVSCLLIGKWIRNGSLETTAYEQN